MCLWIRGSPGPVGALEGQITDASNAVISGADVTARNAQTGLTRTARSSRLGTFRISNLPAGEYSTDVRAQGFATFPARAIRVNIAKTALYDIRLELASAHTEVNISGQTVMVDTSQTIGNRIYR